MTTEPRKSTVQPVNPMTVAEALSQFPANDDPIRVQLLRPVSVFSKTAYSTPVMLPAGLAYVAAMAEKAGYPIDVIDAIGEDIENIGVTSDGGSMRQGLDTERIVERVGVETRVLGVSMMFSQEWVEHRAIIQRIKQARPDLIIVAGGEHPTAMAEYVLRDCAAIDYVVMGEGDLTFLELLSRISSGADCLDLPGVAGLAADGAFIDNGLGRRIKDIDNLPRPAWDLFPVTAYFTDAWSSGIAYGRNMPIVATRGCAFQCTFCSNPGMWTTRYIMRDPKDVVDEIQWLIDAWGANAVDFADLTAIVRKDWVLAFCAELKRRGVDVPWQLPSGTRSEALDAEVLQAMYDTNCRYLVYAPESGSGETLKLVKKKVKLDNLVDSVKDAARIGHTTRINLVIAFPGEKRSSAWKTLWFALGMASAGADDLNIAVFSPYPGSELFHELLAENRIPPLDDAYFERLLVQFDFTLAQTHCENIHRFEAAFYRIFGMAMFYVLSYHVLRPVLSGSAFSAFPIGQRGSDQGFPSPQHVRTADL